MMRLMFVVCLGVFCLMPAIQVAFTCNAAANGSGSPVEAVTPAVAESHAAGAPDSAESKDVKEGVAKPDHQALNEPAGTEKVFDMDALIEQIKESHAIGVFTKLALRSDALDMVDMFKAYRQKASDMTLDELRAHFNGLFLKVLALLDDDPALSREISMAREGIWKSLLEVQV